MDINEAILRVITCDRKDNEKEAFKVVKQAGYETIYYGKYRGKLDWRVKNHKTGKYVKENDIFRKGKAPERSYDGFGLFIVDPFSCKADLKSFLDKPVNTGKELSCETGAIYRHFRLKHIKERILYRRELISKNESAIREIKDRNGELENIIKKDEEEFERLKIEYGLI